MSKAALPRDHGQDIEHSLEKMPGLETFRSRPIFLNSSATEAVCGFSGFCATARNV